MRFPLAIKLIAWQFWPCYIVDNEGGSSGSVDEEVNPMELISPYAAADHDGNESDSSSDSDSEDDKLAKKMCLPLKKFLPALQGEGVPNKKSKELLLKYPSLKKLSGQYYDHWKRLKLDGLGTNRSRESDTITGWIVKLRRHVDVHALNQPLRQYAPADSEKMYVLSNDEMGGQEILTMSALKKYRPKAAALVDRSNNRNPCVGIRAAAAFCHPKHRQGMTHYLSGKWYRGDYDQCMATSKAFAEEVLQTFMDPNLEIERPDYMDNEDHDPEQKIDPHKCAYEERDAEWLLLTWVRYVKKKYKPTLEKWYKHTGGGSREPSNFVNYCGGDNWLAWIYAIDIKTDFLLASSANGRPPAFVLQEAGFEADANSEEDNESRSFVTPRKERALLEDGNKILSDLLSVAKQRAEQQALSECAEMEAIAKIEDQKRKLQADPDFSPTTKGKMMDCLIKKKQKLAKKMIENSA